MDANHFNYEVIFVNDGSTDHSWQVIEKLRSESDNVKGIKFRRNYLEGGHVIRDQERGGYGNYGTN